MFLRKSILSETENFGNHIIPVPDRHFGMGSRKKNVSALFV